MSTTAVGEAVPGLRPKALLRRVLVAPVRRTYRQDLTWVLIGVPLTLGCLVSVLVGLAVGVVSSPLFLGLLLIAGTLLFARRLGAWHRLIGRVLLGVRIVAPAPRRLEPGLWSWLKSRVGDPVGWRAVAYLAIRLPVALFTLAVAATLFSYSAATLTYPLWWFTLDGQPMPIFDIQTGSWLSSIPLAFFGLLVFFATPWVLHVVVGADRLLMSGLLGQATLSERVRDLEQSRAAAVAEATVKLRRIERDLHDGAQAQLVALAMRLGMAKAELEAELPDLGQVRTLVATAHANAKQALVELRDLARGIHPAALDAGLGVALSTLASTCGVDARLRVDLPRRPPPAVETIIYFTAAELLTNATKHGGTGVRLAVTSMDGTVRLTVSDGGAGGARTERGGGLAGIAERVRTVDGRLEITSPPGGPTVITVDIPIPN